MTPAEVLANFPEVEAFEEWMGGNLNDALLFREMVFLFDEVESTGPLPDSKMTDFLVRRREEVCLLGTPLSWWTVENAAAILHREGIRFSLKTVTLETRLKYHIDWASFIDVEPLSLTLKFTEKGEFLELSAST